MSELKNPALRLADLLSSEFCGTEHRLDWEAISVTADRCNDPATSGRPRLQADSWLRVLADYTESKPERADGEYDKTD